MTTHYKAARKVDTDEHNVTF